MRTTKINHMILKMLASFYIRCKVASVISLQVLNDSEIHVSKVIMRIMKNLDSSNNFLIHGSIKGLAAACEIVFSSSLDETLMGKVVDLTRDCTGRLGYNVYFKIDVADTPWAAMKFPKVDSQKNIIFKFLYDIFSVDCYERLLSASYKNKIDLKVVALESLVSIAMYDRIMESSVDVLMDLTHSLVKETDESLDIFPTNLGIEFWEIIVETKINIMNETLD